CLAGRPMVVFGDGAQTRDFTYVSDTAAGILLAGEHEGAIGETINLGFGREVTINELATKVSAAVGRPAVVTHDIPRPGDVLRLYADTSKAQALLGFQPTVTLEEGLRRLAAWYEACGVPPERLLEAEVVRNWDVAAAGRGREAALRK